MLDEKQAQCQNPDCGRPIEVIAGHRPRRYCCDACKQAAHRARLKAAQMAAEEAARLARIQEERAVLLDRYGSLLPETLELLQSFRTPSLVEQVARVIVVEKQHARQTYNRERSSLIEELLLMGEQIGFPSLSSEIFDLSAGVPSWLAFCDEVCLEWLYLAKDATHLKVQAAAGRKRLAELAEPT